MTPPSLPAPSPPPLTPGGAWETDVSLEMTVPGTVESFDAANFKANLAASIGVPPAAVTLTVTAASVNVVASIKVTENATGVVASVKALASDSSALSKAVGVTIESVAAPTFSVRAILAPSPPPPPAPPPGGYSPPPPLPPAPYGRESSEFIRAGSTVSELALTLLLAGGGAVLLLLLGYCLLRRPHGKTRKQIAHDVHMGVPKRKPRHKTRWRLQRRVPSRNLSWRWPTRGRWRAEMRYGFRSSTRRSGHPSNRTASKPRG
jgi:hypothetical protein